MERAFKLAPPRNSLNELLVERASKLAPPRNILNELLVESASKPVNKSMDQPEDNPVDNPVEKPVNKSVDQGRAGANILKNYVLHQKNPLNITGEIAQIVV